MLGVRFEAGMELELLVDYDGAQASPQWQRFVEKAQGQPDLLSRVPQDALMAVTGRMDLSFIGRLLEFPLPPDEARKRESMRQIIRGLCLGRDLFDDLLPKFEANFVAFAVPVPDADSATIPFEGLVAWQIPPVAAQDAPPAEADLHAALDNALNSAMNFYAATRNAAMPDEIVTVRTAAHSGAKVRWIEGLANWQPACSVTGTHLVLASSQRVLKAFVDQPADTSLLALPRYQRWAKEFFPQTNELLLINVARLRRFISDRRPAILRLIEQARGVSADQVSARLSRLEDLLPLLDGAFASVQVGNDRVRIVVGGLTASTP